MFVALALLAVTMQQQEGQRVATAPLKHSTVVTAAVPAPTDSGAVAIRTTVPPAIDGRDDDEVWRAAPPVTAFTQWQPTEGKDPRFRTEAKIAYDAANLYVFVRAFDPHPDSIIRILERRDIGVETSWVKTGNYLRVWRKQLDGSWKLAFDVLSHRPKLTKAAPAEEKKPGGE